LTPSKYYYCDVGFRNARLEFRQYEVTHLMKNIIYNELLIRGYSVDVGIVTHDEKTKKERSHANSSKLISSLIEEVSDIISSPPSRYRI
jgi:predicted AAA+ superfamily ATPase